MRSKFNGFCLKCKSKIFIGDEIVYDKELSKWVHETCPVRNSRKKRPTSISEILAQHGGEIQKNPYFDENCELRSFHKEGSECSSCGGYETKKKFVPSKYQQAIFDFVSNGTGHGVIEAVAGSGKTTTILEALSFIPKNASAIFLSFNSHIAEELKNRVPANVTASTIHSCGFQLLQRYYGKIQIDEDKTNSIMDEWWQVSKYLKGPDKKDLLQDGKKVENPPGKRKENVKKRSFARAVVSLCKATLIDYNDPSSLAEMVSNYGLSYEGEDSNGVFEVLRRIPEIMSRSLPKGNTVEKIDYDDMIWLPVVEPRLAEHFPKYDWVFVDELQDLNAAQIKFVMMLVSRGGRVIAVGDRKQSMYGFRGADVYAVERTIRTLNATVLPLSISYRCAKNIIKEAQKIVPQIEYHPSAPDGLVAKIDAKDFMSMVSPGDMILCRTNAPLVRPVFDLIRRGIKVSIRGKDIGEALVRYAEQFEAGDLYTLRALIVEATKKEVRSLVEKGREVAASYIQDRCDTILSVSDECQTVSELIDKLEDLFDNKRSQITASSIHRAKGLEANRVFILRPDLIPHPKAKFEWEKAQEENIMYVAITRAKLELYYVQGIE